MFIGLCVWLLRKVVKAARTEDDLEAGRLQGALADELQAARARAAGSQMPVPMLVPDVAPDPAGEPAPESVPEPEPETGHGDQHESGDEDGRGPLAGADLRGAHPAHLPLVSALVAEREAQTRARHTGPADVERRVEVLWVRSNATHCAWCERRHAATLAARAMTRDVICVVQIERGRIVERWSFG